MLTFPVRHGSTLNVVVFKQDDGEWPDTERLTRKGRREDALRDFEGWCEPVRKVLELCDEELSVVSGSGTTTESIDGLSGV